jgi:hypothetical protein
LESARQQFVKESWDCFDSKTEHRLTKSLKIIKGKQADIFGWIRLHRDADGPPLKRVNA